jgi:hypothetical protein
MSNVRNVFILARIFHSLYKSRVIFIGLFVDCSSIEVLKLSLLFETLFERLLLYLLCFILRIVCRNPFKFSKIRLKIIFIFYRLLCLYFISCKSGPVFGLSHKFAAIWFINILFVKHGGSMTAKGFIIHMIRGLYEFWLIMIVMNFKGAPGLFFCRYLVWFIIVMHGAFCVEGDMGFGTAMFSWIVYRLPQVHISQMHLLSDILLMLKLWAEALRWSAFIGIFLFKDYGCQKI